MAASSPSKDPLAFLNSTIEKYERLVTRNPEATFKAEQLLRSLVLISPGLLRIKSELKAQTGTLCT